MIQNEKLCFIRQHRMAGQLAAAEQGRTLVAASSGQQLRAVRNKAVLAMLIGCRLRRAEIVTVKVQDFQLREDHWVLPNLVDKAPLIRNLLRYRQVVPVPKSGLLFL